MRSHPRERSPPSSPLSGSGSYRTPRSGSAGSPPTSTTAGAGYAPDAMEHAEPGPDSPEHPEQTRVTLTPAAVPTSGHRQDPEAPSRDPRRLDRPAPTSTGSQPSGRPGLLRSSQCGASIRNAEVGLLAYVDSRDVGQRSAVWKARGASTNSLRLITDPGIAAANADLTQAHIRLV